jgi:hypothetical protein
MNVARVRVRVMVRVRVLVGVRVRVRVRAICVFPLTWSHLGLDTVAEADRC